jgi:hypothetical protein
MLTDSRRGDALRPEGSSADLLRALLIPLGLGVFLVGGILTALLAARLLPPVDYTIYASFASVWGIAILATAGALEQESSMRGTSGQRTRTLFAAMLKKGTVVWLSASAILAIPALGWQERLLGGQWHRWVALAVVGGLLVVTSAILRGIGTGRGRYGLVGASNAATGVAMLAAPLLLIGLGTPPLDSFLLGAVGAWIAGLLVLVVAAKAGQLRAVSASAPASQQRRMTGWMVAGNLLMTASVLAVPSVLRWHVESIGADLVADVQLLVTISRLASTVVLGLLPVMIATMTSRPVRVTGLATARIWLLVAVGVAIVAASVLVAIGIPLIGWLTGRATAVTLLVVVAATIPVVLLAPAIVLMALSASRGRYGLIVCAWTCSLLALMAALLFDPRGQILVVLAWIGLGAGIPLLVFVVGLSTVSGTGTATTTPGHPSDGGAT